MQWRFPSIEGKVFNLSVSGNVIYAIPQIEDVEKLRLTFIRCLKLPQVADRVSKTKVCWLLNLM